jgi:glycosyltransferase involved in cell wall biosynthesis
MVDAVMVNCEAMRRHLIDDEHISGERIELCYNGVTEEFFPAHPPCPEAFSNASIVIGTVCALRPEKALSLLQEAFSQVLHLDPGMKLVFVGSGPQLSLLQKNASRLGIENSNVFIPAADDVATWLRSMNIFVSASISEAFSNALLEAMACGCSVVGSRVGGTPELIGNNEERGFLFKSGNVADLVDKLSRLIINPNLRRDLGRRAATFVRENLTIEIAAERTAAIYEKLLVRKTGCQIPVSVIGRQGCLTVR